MARNVFMFFIIPGISWGIIKDLVDWYRKLTPPCELIGFRAKKKNSVCWLLSFPSFSFSQFFTFSSEFLLTPSNVDLFLIGLLLYITKGPSSNEFPKLLNLNALK